MESELGNFEGGQEYIDRLITISNDTNLAANLEYMVTAVMISIVARITGSLDMLDVAKTAAETGLRSPNVTPHRSETLRSALAMIALLRNDKAVATE